MRTYSNGEISRPRNHTLTRRLFLTFDRALFQHYRHTTSLLQLKDAKHGFTNPAQDFNENPAFAYHKESADKAWRQAIAFLKRRIGTDSTYL
jgi:dienelactone hydrolase